MKGEGMDKVREALAELVALKDLHDRCENMPSEGDGPAEPDAQAMWQEYRRRKPLAWAAAREALSVQPAEPVELGDRFMEILRAIHGDMPDDFADSARLAFVHATKVTQPAPSVPAVPEGWLPIETAPKGCEQLLLRVPTGMGVRVGAMACQGYWMHSFWVIFNADEAVQRVEPTHWMRLPAAPHPAAKGGAE